MSKELVQSKSTEIEVARVKHKVLPQSRGGWILTGITFIGSSIVCAVSHFDGGTTLAGLFVVGISSGFSDDIIHGCIYGKRFPVHLAMSSHKSITDQLQEAAAEFCYRWLGFERPTDPQDTFKRRFAYMLGMPIYEDEVGEPKEEDDVIIMGPSSAATREREQEGTVNLARDLKLPINDIAGKSILIVGIKRSGKTTVGVRIAEELGSKFDMPMFIPDLKGDWLSLVSVLPNAVVLGKGQASEKHAIALGYSICEEGIQIILDIPSYNDMDEVASVMAGIIDGIFLWERKHPQSRKLCAVFLDEAQSFFPQDIKDSIIPTPEKRDKALNAYMRALTIGGSLGLFTVVMTQRIAQASNKIIGQPELLVLLKQTMDNDLNRYKGFTNIPTEKVRSLLQGQGIFVDYEGKSTIHKFDMRKSSDAMSATPRYRPSNSPVSESVSRKRFQTKNDDFELENAVPPVERKSETEPETDATKVLREIGKRLKAGEDPVKIRKSLGINSGRSVQEINAALQFLQDSTDEEDN